MTGTLNSSYAVEQITHQPDWSNQVGADPNNPGGGWCICMWATARLISSVGCDNVHLDCSSTDLAYVEKSYTDGGVNLAPAKECLVKKCGQASATSPSPPPSLTTPQQLWAMYSNIFTSGNRNAASHLWFTYVFERSSSMSRDVFLKLSSSYCAISGSPVNPRAAAIFGTSLPVVTGGSSVAGYMYHCCWPCACDTKDFVQLDTKSIVTTAGTQSYFVTVIGDPCANPTKITAAFKAQAPEIECDANGKLRGATYSDHGHVILSLYFTSVESMGVGVATATVTSQEQATVTSMGHAVTGTALAEQCTARKNQGYTSGMGQIFRQLASMNPIVPASVPQQVTQSMRLSSVTDAASYQQDAALKRACELGYGKALGIVSCVDGSCSYQHGCSVSSRAERRSATITFTATTSGALLPAEGASATQMATGITAVVAGDTTLATVTPPAVGAITALNTASTSPPATTAERSDARSGSDDSNGNKGLIIGVATTVVVVAFLALCCWDSVRSRIASTTLDATETPSVSHTQLKEKHSSSSDDDEVSTMSDASCASDVELMANSGKRQRQASAVVAQV